MASYTITMSQPSLPSTRQQGFVRRLVMLLLFIAGMVFWMSALHRYQTNISGTLMIVFADVVVALAAGFGARLAFYHRGWFVRFLVAASSLTLGLYALGFLTNWKMGIGPFEFWRSRIDWYEAAQLAGGLALVLIALKAWWKPPSETVNPPAIPIRASRQEMRPQTDSPHLPFRLPRLHLPASWISHAGRGPRLRVRKTRANGGGATGLEPVVVSRQVKPARARRRRRSKPELQLSVYAEHRCPYCLEEVKRNDPRGVKECEICHTLHHADCWNITGMCQIPHLNSLSV